MVPKTWLFQNLVGRAFEIEAELACIWAHADGPGGTRFLGHVIEDHAGQAALQLMRVFVIQATRNKLERRRP